VGEQIYSKSRADEALALLENVSLNDDFVEFLTLPAYEHIE